MKIISIYRELLLFYLQNYENIKFFMEMSQFVHKFFIKYTRGKFLRGGTWLVKNLCVLREEL